MGKEIRVAMSVVGVLLLLFCGLLYARISGSGLAVPDVAISAVPRLTAQRAQVPLQPTIVQQPHAWEELVAPTGVGVVPDGSLPSSEPTTSVARRSANPHRISEVELISAEDSGHELTNPRATSYTAAPATEPSPHYPDIFMAGEALPLPELPPTATEAEPIRLRLGDTVSFPELAEQAYGDRRYARALERTLREEGPPDACQPGSVVELPAAEQLRARYPQLCPLPAPPGSSLR